MNFLYREKKLKTNILIFKKKHVKKIENIVNLRNLKSMRNLPTLTLYQKFILNSKVFHTFKILFEIHHTIFIYYTPISFPFFS